MLCQSDTDIKCIVNNDFGQEYIWKRFFKKTIRPFL